MEEEPHMRAKQLLPMDTLMEISMGHTLTRCPHVVADLGIADTLEDTPRSAGELASATGTHAGALGRVLRLLSAHGVFQQCDGKYSHTPPLAVAAFGSSAVHAFVCADDRISCVLVNV